MKMNCYNATATQQKQSPSVEHRAVGDHANLLEKLIEERDGFASAGNIALEPLQLA